jgi:hypothetical protein
MKYTDNLHCNDLCRLKICMHENEDEICGPWVAVCIALV